MIRVIFYGSRGRLTGFRISGHAGYADSGRDVVCAAVSSAVQLTVNTLEKFDCKPEASAEDNVTRCRAKASGQTASAILELLQQHLVSIGEEYPRTIKISISEV